MTTHTIHGIKYGIAFRGLATIVRLKICSKYLPYILLCLFIHTIYIVTKNVQR